MPDTHAENRALAMGLVTRNQAQVTDITYPSSWLNDEEQPDGTHELKHLVTSQKHWLKVTQSAGEQYTLFPIDGNMGVFNGGGLPVQHPERFEYPWKTAQGVEQKAAGDCDGLIISKQWGFIEFKTEATSIKPDQIANNHHKAEMQLARAMAYFREALPDETLPCECIIVLPAIYPKQAAQYLNRATKFLKTHRAPLKILHADNQDTYQLV